MTVSRLEMNADEWSAIIRAMRDAPAWSKTPHWARAMQVLSDFFEPIRAQREGGGDPRVDAVEVRCMVDSCRKIIGKGHNFVFEAATGASYHTLCWLARRMGPFMSAISNIRDQLKKAESEGRSVDGKFLETVVKALDGQLGRKEYLMPQEEGS